MERGLTIMSVPFSASFHLYSELFTLNLRDLGGTRAIAGWVAEFGDGCPV